MGISSSSLNSLKESKDLIRFTSDENIQPNEDFWDRLLSFSFRNPFRSWQESKTLEDNLFLLLERIAQNNQTSKNVGSLVKVFVDKVSQLDSIACDDDKENTGYSLTLCQTYNSLYMLRCCSKHLVQMCTEDNLIRSFEAKVITEGNSVVTEESGTQVLEQFICALINTLADTPDRRDTYALRVEIINTLLVLLSVQMYSVRNASKSFIYKTVMSKKCSIHALVVTKVLLANYMKQEPAPRDEGGSAIIGLASGFWNVLTLGYGKTQEDPSEEAILARLSILLLLVLTNHCTSDRNAYRDALFSCCDASESSEGGDHAVSGFKIQYAKLLETLCDHQNDDQSTLLLYMLLHRNHSFRTFVLSRTADLDALVVPILKILYNSGQRSSHHIYMALIILLILSEDSLFNESVHDIILKNVVWYRERHLSEVSLGGLTILVIMRTIQYNISRTRDKFLHTNLLATLANMSNYFRHLSPYVCDKIVSVFHRLSKRMNRISNHMHQNYNGTGELSDKDTDIASLAGSVDATHDLSIYEEVLRMILEILNACLANQLTHNPNLTYTLLYNRNIFEAFQNNPSFQDIVMNIETVLTYFANRVEGKEKNLSVAEVYEIIQHSSLQWPSDRLKKFPELRFRYVEDDRPEEFFIPYVWSLVFRFSGIPFASQNISLFNPHPNVI